MRYLLIVNDRIYDVVQNVGVTVSTGCMFADETSIPVVSDFMDETLLIHVDE